MMPPVSVVNWGIARLAVFKADDVGGHQRLQRGGGAFTAQIYLAHVGYVEQPRGLPHMQMFFEDTFRKLHRHVIAAKPDHFRAQAAMHGVQRCNLQSVSFHNHLPSAGRAVRPDESWSLRLVLIDLPK